MTKSMIRALLLTTALGAASPALALQATGDTASAAAQTAPVATSNPADATAPSNPQNEIVVTGIRRSLQQARDLKRNATQFVDAIVADDIGKLPDRNVAESLQRVSGVQVDRGIAEGTSVSIRGLRQNVFLFNGREILDATGRGGTGLDQLGTSTYGLLALVPSELISRLEVTKLAGADQIAGALGGIVDIQTRMPLDGPSQIAVKGGLTYDDLPKKAGYELFGMASHRSEDGNFGALLAVAYDKRDLSQQGLDTFSGYTRFVDPTGTVRFGNADARPEDIEENRRRFGIDGALQWRPAPGIELSADSFYSRLYSDRDRYWLSFTPTAGLSNATYSANNILLSGTAKGPVLTNTEFATTRADVWSSALRGKFDVGGGIKGSAELSYDKSTSSYHQLYWRLQPIASITPTVNFDFTKGDLGSYAISGIDLTDPTQLRMTILFDNTYRATSEGKTARTDWTADLGQGFLRMFEIGARYNDVDSAQNPMRVDIRPAGGIPATQLSKYLTLYSNPDFAQGEFAGLPRTYLAASSAFTGCAAMTDFPVVSQNAQCLAPTQNTNAYSSTFEIKERFLEGYAKLDFDQAFGGAELTGNVGLRYVHRDMDSIGNLINAAGNPTPTTFHRNDNEWLPSAVAKLAVSRDLIFRLGAAQVVAFPNTADLNNGVTLFNNAVFVNGVQTTPGTGNGGAPNLDPFKAKQVDASAEYYFAHQGLVSLGLFYKDISSFIVQRQSAESYGGVDYLINRKVNGAGATVKGVEGLIQLPLGAITRALDGFGVVATYSYIDSSTPIRDVAGRVLPFPGLSKNNANIIGYYEKGPFSLRVAYNWRSAYLVSLSAANTGIYNDAYTDLSATLRYDFTKNISLTLEANNILDEKQRTYDGSEEGLRTNLFFGRLYRASISVKF